MRSVSSFVESIQADSSGMNRVMARYHFQDCRREIPIRLKIPNTDRTNNPISMNPQILLISPSLSERLSSNPDTFHTKILSDNISRRQIFPNSHLGKIYSNQKARYFFDERNPSVFPPLSPPRLPIVCTKRVKSQSEYEGVSFMIKKERNLFMREIPLDIERALGTPGRLFSEMLELVLVEPSQRTRCLKASWLNDGNN